MSAGVQTSLFATGAGAASVAGSVDARAEHKRMKARDSIFYIAIDGMLRSGMERGAARVARRSSKKYGSKEQLGQSGEAAPPGYTYTRHGEVDLSGAAERMGFSLVSGCLRP